MEGGCDLLRLTADGVRIVALQEVRVDALEGGMVTRQSCLLERAAVGFVVAGKVRAVLRAHRLQVAVELKSLDGCGGTDGIVRCQLLSLRLRLTLALVRCRVRYRNRNRRVDQ